MTELAWVCGGEVHGMALAEEGGLTLSATLWSTERACPAALTCQVSGWVGPGHRPWAGWHSDTLL